MNNYLQHIPHVAQSYCFKESILIYPVPVNKTSWNIEVSFKGKKRKSEVSYNKAKLTDKIWELYEYFYNKREI